MVTDNFVYDSEGNLIEDKSKNLKISYDWRGMPVEFRMETMADEVHQPTRGCSRDSVRLLMAYDGSGRRVSKTRERKACISETSSGATFERTYAADWERELVTHYTGIGTEVRESFHNGTPSETKVVVNMPNGLGRYMPEDASAPVVPSTTLDENGKPTDWSVFNPKFEWYLKNHLGSTMLVYGTQGSSNADVADLGEVKKAYDYRSFGEQIDLIADAGDKVTENFTGKERDDETELNYFGARYLDPMLGMWISVDPARQLSSPYLYVGNGMNPINGVDPDGNRVHVQENGTNLVVTMPVSFSCGETACSKTDISQVTSSIEKHLSGQFGEYNVTTNVVLGEYKGVAPNEITLVQGPGTAHANIANGTATIYMNGAGTDPEYTSAHEGGHLMGLMDRYIEFSSSGETRNTYVPPEYRDNLMGKHGKYNLQPHQIEEMLNSDYNTVE